MVRSRIGEKMATNIELNIFVWLPDACMLSRGLAEFVPVVTYALTRGWVERWWSAKFQLHVVGIRCFMG